MKKEEEPTMEFPVPESEEKKELLPNPPPYEEPKTSENPEPQKRLTNIPPPPEKIEDLARTIPIEEAKATPASKIPPTVAETDYGKEFLSLLMDPATSIEKRKQLVMRYYSINKY